MQASRYLSQYWSPGAPVICMNVLVNGLQAFCHSVCHSPQRSNSSSEPPRSVNNKNGPKGGEQGVPHLLPAHSHPRGQVLRVTQSVLARTAHPLLGPAPPPAAQDLQAVPARLAGGPSASSLAATLVTQQPPAGRSLSAMPALMHPPLKAKLQPKQRHPNPSPETRLNFPAAFPATSHWLRLATWKRGP